MWAALVTSVFVGLDAPPRLSVLPVRSAVCLGSFFRYPYQMELSPGPVKPLRGRPPLPEAERIERRQLQEDAKREARRRHAATNPPRRPPGRPRLPSAERRSRIRASQEKWKLANRERYIAKKAECAQRPENKARRRVSYRARTRFVPCWVVAPGSERSRLVPSDPGWCRVFPGDPEYPGEPE